LLNEETAATANFAQQAKVEDIFSILSLFRNKKICKNIPFDGELNKLRFWYKMFFLTVD